ncbi:hypothetical protein [Carboxylicivirga marina]|uniref:STAS domain-containing protein n=1 Tax=Carboxylicivirga marina TaxID=2800988 RepID=A0ABS1HNV8_9BACT|nr:hypothetical protein [Carboxylicivirga marina]MBK3519331.1 hypothetical protein [Carboxylicivirga marina]
MIKLTFKIIRELNLIVEYYQGDITVHDIIRNKKATIQHPDFNKDANVVLDLRDANVMFEKDDMQTLVTFFKSNSEFQGDKKAVYLTSKPQEVVNTMLFSLKVGEFSIKPQTVSTIEAAVAFMHIDGLDAIRLDAILGELKGISQL